MNARSIGFALVLFSSAACGDGKQGATSAAPAASGAAPSAATSTAAAAAAPAKGSKEWHNAIYKEIFHTGKAGAAPPLVEVYVAKVGAPKKTEGKKRFWYARDAAKDCFEITLADDGMWGASKLFDEKVAAEKCGA